MAATKLKSIRVYLEPSEYEEIAADAEDHGVTVSAYVRARLGFKITKQGAPTGNKNRKKTAARKADGV